MRGRLHIEFEDHAVKSSEGDFLAIPRDVRHNSVADDECWVILIETMTTKHTGDVTVAGARTIAEQLA